MLELRCGGKKDVGVICRIRLEVFEHDSKQVRALESCQHLLLVRRNGGGIAVVNDDRADRRFRSHQCIAKAAHVDGSGIPSDQVGPLERSVVVLEKSARAEDGSAAWVT